MQTKTFSGTLDSLSPIRQYLKSIAGNAGVSKKASYNLQLAADELVTNTILYGYEEAGLQGDITIFSEIIEDQLVVTIQDSAVPFDPLSKEMPSKEDLSKPLNERPIGGLGIFLVLNGLDEFRYEFKDGFNFNTLVLHLT